MTIEIPLNVVAGIIQSLIMVHEGLAIGGLVVAEENEALQEELKTILMNDIETVLDQLKAPMEKRAAKLFADALLKEGAESLINTLEGAISGPMAEA
jgi:hypothetical protein